jgi:hypothetical protein
MTKHGKSRSRTYRIWVGMLNRCSKDTKSKNKRNYIDRGIKVCDRWKYFDAFFEDMGEAPEGLSIDRIDNDKGYEPSNCRWASAAEQSNNTRKNVVLRYNNKVQTVSQWAREIGILQSTLSYRIRRGWAVERALSVGAQK